MSTTPAGLTTFPVTVHEFLPNPDSKKPTHIYEYGVSNSTENALVFIGGLGDGPHGVPYIRHIASSLTTTSLGYTVFEVRLSSAFAGWGTSSISKDVGEITCVVRYLKKQLHKKKVVLMGHSTGCQDCVAYLLHRISHIQQRMGYREEEHEGEANSEEEEEFPEIDGIILQGPVSDREAIGMNMPREDMEEAIKLARRMIREGKENEYMPKDKLPVDMRETPVTAYRWDSLASPRGHDDFFSSDFSDTEAKDIWGPLNKPVLVVPSEEDEWVPKSINVADLIQYWSQFCRPNVYSKLSGLIPGANHRVDNDEGRRWLADRVLRFLGEVEKGIEIASRRGTPMSGR
ncbi:Protein of unknown function (DUF1749) domain containing protein [Naviculisporaceae sp. PSN 640]